MPLGNLTSQFFANVYLNELGYFIKHELRLKYYLRYVDDFIILHNNKNILQNKVKQINNFLENNLKIKLHKGKSKIISLSKGIPFLGSRHFYYHSILKKHKIKLIKYKLDTIIKEYNSINNYEKFMQRIESIFAHIEIANTFHLRKNLLSKIPF